MLGPANREYKMLNDNREVAKPRPVAIYRAPPNAKLLRIEFEYIWVEKTSKTGDRDKKCLAKRRSALPVPRSTNSSHQISAVIITPEDNKRTLQEKGKECDKENQKNRNYAAPDPVEHRNEIITSWLASDDVPQSIDLANIQLLV